MARDAIHALLDLGADVLRINMAHGRHEEHAEVIKWAREACDSGDKPLAVLADLAGPKIRLGGLFEDPTYCMEDQEFLFVRGENATSPHELTCTYERLVDELEVGDRVMLADGVVSLARATADVLELGLA